MVHLLAVYLLTADSGFRWPKREPLNNKLLLGVAVPSHKGRKM